MLDKRIVRKLTHDECNSIRNEIKAELALTATRIYRLLGTQARNPKWAYYDKYAEDIVGINIRIEEQYAVSEMLEDDLKLIEERVDALLGIVALTGSESRLKEPVYQLGFFDSDKKRERMGVPC